MHKMAATYSVVHQICNHTKRKISTNPICCYYVTPTILFAKFPQFSRLSKQQSKEKSTYFDHHFFSVDQCRKTGRAFFFRVHAIVTDEIFRVWTWKLFYLACWQQDKNLKKIHPACEIVTERSFEQHWLERATGIGWMKLSKPILMINNIYVFDE